MKRKLLLSDIDTISLHAAQGQGGPPLSLDGTPRPASGLISIRGRRHEFYVAIGEFSYQESRLLRDEMTARDAGPPWELPAKGDFESIFENPAATLEIMDTIERHLGTRPYRFWSMTVYMTDLGRVWGNHRYVASFPNETMDVARDDRRASVVLIREIPGR